MFVGGILTKGAFMSVEIVFVSGRLAHEADVRKADPGRSENESKSLGADE